MTDGKLKHAGATPADAASGGELRSGEVARLVGVSKDTLRFYERMGLLARPRRAANNYRLYPADVVGAEPRASATLRSKRRARRAQL
jgi:predicted site-specific integrase-resolvase